MSGDDMTLAELAAHFGESIPKPEAPPESDENDIYHVAARVKNLARADNAFLTPVGEMLCNSYSHVLRSLYAFARTLTNESERNNLIALIRKHEGMPSDLIAATKVGVQPNEAE